MVAKSRSPRKSHANKVYVNHMAIFTVPINITISTFKRKMARPDDCVINALELLGILNPITADMMRIVMQPGGVDTNNIQKLFTLIDATNIWRFQPYLLVDTFIDRVNLLKAGEILFCGYDNSTTAQGHVFLIGRMENGELYLIDPQIFSSPCILSGTNNCSKFILGKERHFILHALPYK